MACQAWCHEFAQCCRASLWQQQRLWLGQQWAAEPALRCAGLLLCRLCCCVHCSLPLASARCKPVWRPSGIQPEMPAVADRTTMPTSGLQLSVPIPWPLSQHAEYSKMAGEPTRLPQSSCQGIMDRSMTDRWCCCCADLEPAQALAAAALTVPPAAAAAGVSLAGAGGSGAGAGGSGCSVRQQRTVHPLPSGVASRYTGAGTGGSGPGTGAGAGPASAPAATGEGLPAGWWLCMCSQWLLAAAPHVSTAAWLTPVLSVWVGPPAGDYCRWSNSCGSC